MCLQIEQWINIMQMVYAAVSLLNKSCCVIFDTIVIFCYLPLDLWCYIRAYWKDVHKVIWTFSLDS